MSNLKPLRSDDWLVVLLMMMYGSVLCNVLLFSCIAFNKEACDKMPFNGLYIQNSAKFGELTNAIEKHSTWLHGCIW